MAIALLAILGIAVVYPHFLLNGEPANDTSVAADGEIVCTEKTQLVPKDTEGNSFTSYVVKLCVTEELKDIVKGCHLLYIDRETGFSMNEFGNLPSGSYGLMITDNATGINYEYPNVHYEKDGNNEAPDQRLIIPKKGEDPEKPDGKTDDSTNANKNDEKPKQDNTNQAEEVVAYEPAASSWIREYQGSLYSGGVSANGQYPAKMEFEGVRSVGVVTSSFSIHDGYLYFIDGSGGVFQGSLCRQQLQGDGSDRVTLAEDVMGYKFYIVGDYLYFNRQGESFSGGSRVRLSGGVVESLDEVKWVFGASKDSIFYTKQGESKGLYRSDSNMEQESILPDFAEPNKKMRIYLDLFETADGKFFSFTGDALTVYDGLGTELFSRVIEGADPERYYPELYTDGRSFGIISNNTALIISLENGEVVETIPISYTGEDAQPRLLYFDDTYIYFSAFCEIRTNEDGTAYNTEAYRQDRKTGVAEVTGTWFTS